MAIYTASVSGKSMKDKHTHYEIATNIGPYTATITITGDIAAEFRSHYRYPICECERFFVTTDFIRNFQRDAECRNPFASSLHLFGRIRSVDEIVIAAQKKD